MSFRQRVKYLLVKKLAISNKLAQELINKGKVKVNNNLIDANILLNNYDTILVDNKVIVEPNFEYYAFYKPIGVECTLNPNIPNNLLDFMPLQTKLFCIGRLDKQSEGLLLLTNNGHIYDKLLRPENHIEKQYLVKVNQHITHNFINNMQNGITILGKKTAPCLVEPINDFEFTITLTQGINRQIRRMCYKLGYDVLQLKRLSMGQILLNNMQPKQLIKLTNIQVNYLVNL